jgi:hypothetical protein
MSGQITLESKPLRTDFAFERVRICVQYQVFPKVLLEGERLLANVTGK